MSDNLGGDRQLNRNQQTQASDNQAKHEQHHKGPSLFGRVMGSVAGPMVRNLEANLVQHALGSVPYAGMAAPLVNGFVRGVRENRLNQQVSGVQPVSDENMQYRTAAERAVQVTGRMQQNNDLNASRGNFQVTDVKPAAAQVNSKVETSTGSLDNTNPSSLYITATPPEVLKLPETPVQLRDYGRGSASQAQDVPGRNPIQFHDYGTRSVVEGTHPVTLQVHATEIQKPLGSTSQGPVRNADGSVWHVSDPLPPHKKTIFETIHPDQVIPKPNDK